MKQGWEIKKIKDICEKASSNIAQNKITSLDGDYPVYGASGFVQNVDFYHRDTEYIGIVKDGSGVGRVNIYPAYSSLLGTLQYIIPKQGYSLNFVAYALKSLKLADFASGAAIPHIYFKDYGEVAISVPSLAEQERIVEILDREFERIDAMKANAEQNLQHAKDLFQAALRQELQPKEGWGTAPMSTIYDVRDGTHDSPRYHTTGYPLITSKNLCEDFIDMDNVKYISKEDYDKINERSKVDIGDVLFAMIGTIGNPTLVVKEPNFAIKNMALFKVPNNQSGSLLRYILSTDEVLGEMKKKAKGSNQPFVSLGYLRGFEISIPATREQQDEIVARLDILNERCKALEENYKKTIVLCDDMKQALLRKAFNGEL